MPTSLETLDAANTKLDSLIATTATATEPAEPAENAVDLKPSDAIAAIGAELAEPAKLSKARIEYLNGVLAEINSAIAKSNYDGETVSQITIRVVDAPDRRPAPTRTFIDPAKLPSSGTPSGSIFAANSTTTKAEKVAEIEKLLLDPEALTKFLADEKVAKSAATDKLAEIITLFGLTESDLKDQYEVRWKIGDLIGLLQNQIKLERILAGVETETSKAASASAGTSDEWPADMASAKYDEKKRAYEKQPSRWNG